MAGAAVTWQDYSGLGSMDGMFDPGIAGGAGHEAGFAGTGTQGDVTELVKALQAGSDINAPASAAGEGFPLRVEDLSKVLFTTTYQAKQIRFWKTLFKDPAYNTVTEFNRLNEYGSGDAAYMAEGDLPEEDDSTYERAYTQIKFLGTTRRVTHVMSLLRTAHGPAIARETVNGTLWLLKQLERGLFNGDSSLVGVQFDGLEKLLVDAWATGRSEDDQSLGYEDTVNVIDMRGASLSEDHVTDMVERLVAEPNYGDPSHLWAPTGPIKDLSKIMYPKERYDLPAPSGGVAGIAIKAISNPFGDPIKLEPDIFIPDSVRPTAAGVGKAARRPGLPTVGAPTSPVYAGANQTFFAAADAGTYIYQVVACSRYGKSAPVITAGIAVAALDQVSIGVTDNGPDTSYYELYRSDLGGAATTCRLISRHPRSGPTQTLVDLNRFLPDTSKAYMLTQSPDILRWKQLAPFSKIPLATIDSSIRWMMLMYGALQVQQPRKCGLYINIGRLPTGAYAV
jgi:hypothetical protein